MVSKATKRAPVDIVLGGERFAIRPLTVDQVEAIETLLEKDPKAGAKQARAIIAVGLARDHADTDLGATEASVGDLATAMAVILQQGGFLPDKPGEAKAAAGNAPHGRKSAGA